MNVQTKQNTVNVVESINGTINQLLAFSDTPEGNVVAEQVFTTLFREHDAVLSDEDLQVAIEEGNYNDGNEYQLFLVHST